MEAGHEIVQVAQGPERMSVAEVNALLYKPGHPADQLQRALRIPALSAGWRASLQALLDQQQSGAATGNAGLAPASGQLPAWTGLRPLRVARKIRESRNVISLVLEPADGHPLAAPLPGQFVVLRLKPTSGAPALTRSYSVSGEPSTEHYRVSVKREPAGAAGTYIDEKLQVGDVVDASAPRGNFALSAGRRRRRLPECRHRRHPRARDAARAGGRSVDEAGLVAPRSPEPPGASVRRGSARPPGGPAPWPQPCPLQLA